jgi:D-alanyl-lipoteichoic acid acyltransferase DltB (MBOAT superfamily)
MQFNSLDYAVFLLLTLVGFWALVRAGQRPLRIAFVLIASCAFYMAWNPWYIALILFSTVVDWAVARGIASTEDETLRKRWLTVSVVVNLSLLGTFKYFNFGMRTAESILGGLGLEAHLPMLAWALPVGISFYTFESLSYCIDVYRRQCAPAKSPLDLLYFITFFPKLVAGPIARPADLLPQLQNEPRLEPARIGEALFLIGRGLIKKICFADYISVNLVDRVFDTPEAYTGAEAIVALYGFTLQIFMDFSGYTDIARGSAKLFAIELPENFESPYRATNPADFWRRWHMTLSTWLRDYLYFPLGGSKHGTARTYFNLWLTIFLIGLWHGASWTFVIYGTLQATAVVIHRFVSQRSKSETKPTPEGDKNYREDSAEKPPKAKPSMWITAGKIALTMQFVVFTRILFRADSLENARAIVARIFSNSWSMANVAPTVALVLLLGFAAHYVPAKIENPIRNRLVALPAPIQGALLALLVFGLMHIAGSETVPYIYFQF